MRDLENILITVLVGTALLIVLPPVLTYWLTDDYIKAKRDKK